jgi:hypothetical protein
MVSRCWDDRDRVNINANELQCYVMYTLPVLFRDNQRSAPRLNRVFFLNNDESEGLNHKYIMKKIVAMGFTLK